jgi:nitroimidazol reductase NimA-like FMN-containing flavoprotein (pyridoxamine 5'-phosphate oxidase superfamily)
MTTDLQTPMTILDRDECWNLMRSAPVGRLAVSVGAHPDIFPVNFVIDHGTVVFRTAEGTKLAASLLGVAVAFEVDGYDPAAGEAWSVVVKGRAVEIQRMHELFDAMDLPLFPWHAAPKHRFVRIVPDEISGRRFHVVDRPAATTTESERRAAAPE